MNIIDFPSRRLRLTATTREAIENEIERLFELLDALDGDPDLEPALGWTLRAGALSLEACNDEDREGDEERELDDAEMGIADLDGLVEQAPFYWVGSANHVL